MAIIGTISVSSRQLPRVQEAINYAVATVNGQGGSHQLARQLWCRVGMQALTYIKEAFLVKAAGGTDEAGDHWPPLAKSTVAYSRRHPGVPPSGQRAAKRPSWTLTAQQRKEWWSHYGRYLAIYKGDKGHAAAVAWLIMKADGANTLIGLYGDTPVEILRDKGLLLNSLSPGIAPDQAGSTPPRVANQVFRAEPGRAIVGTNRKWAGVHHHGSKDGRIPQRRLWPDTERWPARWLQGLASQARLGMVDLIVWLVRAA